MIILNFENNFKKTIFKKLAAQEEVVRNSFKIGEAGKVVLTIDNLSSRNKKLVYRSKVKRHL